MNLEQAYEFIEERVAIYWEALYFAVTQDIGTVPPIHYINKPTNYAGLAYYNGKVEYNLAYFVSSDDIQELEETIAHELCHIVQFRVAKHAKQAHGPEFRAYMRSIGFIGTTHHRMSARKAKTASAKHFDMLMEVEI